MLLHFAIQALVTALAVLIAARIVPGIRVRSLGSALIFAVVLGLLNVLVRWLLIVLLLPFVVLTFGLFIFVINAFLFWLADKIVEGVEVDGFGAVLLGSLVTSGIGWGIMFLLHRL
jgi:putative membrane protein